MHANIVTFYFLFFLETFWLACKTSHRKSRRRKSGIQISTLKLLGNELTSQSQQPYLQGLVALTGLSLKQMLHWKYSRQLSPSLKYCQPRCSGTLSRIQGDWLDKQMKTIHGSIIYKHLEKKGLYTLVTQYNQSWARDTMKHYFPQNSPLLSLCSPFPNNVYCTVGWVDFALF